MIEKHSSLMPSRVDSVANRRSIDISRVVVPQAVTQKALLGLRCIGHNFRCVESANRKRSSWIEDIIAQRRKRLIGGEMTRAIVEKWHKIHAGLPLVLHGQKCGKSVRQLSRNHF